MSLRNLDRQPKITTQTSTKSNGRLPVYLIIEIYPLLYKFRFVFCWFPPYREAAMSITAQLPKHILCEGT